MHSLETANVLLVFGILYHTYGYWGIMCTVGMADIHDRLKGDPSRLSVTGCMLDY